MSFCNCAEPVSFCGKKICIIFGICFHKNFIAGAQCKGVGFVNITAAKSVCLSDCNGSAKEVNQGAGKRSVIWNFAFIHAGIIAYSSDIINRGVK